MTYLNRRILVFAPHPDDETLGCGGTIIKRLREGYDVTVVVVTDGRHAFSIRGITVNPSPEELKDIRKKEAINAAEVLGLRRDNLLFWDFEDTKIAEGIKSIREKSLAILGEIKPVELYIPYEKDANPDHSALSMMLKDCIEQVNFPITCYQYSINQKHLHLGPIVTRFTGVFKRNLAFVNVAQYIDQKVAAIREYKSQAFRMARASRHKKPTLENYSRFLRNCEVFVRTTNSKENLAS